MKIILLSGGSGKRLWPLSNDVRSKQFLRLLTAPNGSKESMIQRVVRQIKSVGLTDEIVVATSLSQKDSIENQLGDTLSVVTEPCRRDTFPAIALASAYLISQGVSANETVIVMPCDSYIDDSYFHILAQMAQAVEKDAAKLVLMGIRPTCPSTKYGYIVPDKQTLANGTLPVLRFTEKPDEATAKDLIAKGAIWNGGVFAFRLGYLMDVAAKLLPVSDYKGLLQNYASLPKISFDYAVVEKAKSVAVMPYKGQWKDLGTWSTLTDELPDKLNGNVISEGCENTYVINELETPIVCIGCHDMVIAASPDGILISEHDKSENLKHLVDGIGHRPMYEERRWGEYKVIDYIAFPDGNSALTKQLTLRPGRSISYQRHNFRTETWTFINGEGEIVLDGVRRVVHTGDVVTIPCGQLHALRATTPLTFIEVQQGTNVVEGDIERFPYDW